MMEPKGGLRPKTKRKAGEGKSAADLRYMAVDTFSHELRRGVDVLFMLVSLSDATVRLVALEIDEETGSSGASTSVSTNGSSGVSTGVSSGVSTNATCSAHGFLALNTLPCFFASSASAVALLLSRRHLKIPNAGPQICAQMLAASSTAQPA